MKTSPCLLPALAILALSLAESTFGQDGPQSSSSSRSYRTSGSAKVRDPIPPLFIEFTSVPRDSVASMDEDLSVMTRLIDKALDQELGEDAPPVKLKLPMLYTASGRSVRAMYLEGFGALFMIKVNFPVIAPAKAEPRKPEKTPPSEWEQTRNELRTLDEQGEEDTLRPDAARGEVDSSQIESLKKALLHSLKYAANIRGLKPDEFVALSVFGSEVGGVVPVARSRAAAVAAPAAATAGSAIGGPTPPVANSRKKPKAATDEVTVEAGNVASPAPPPPPGPPAELTLLDGKASQGVSRITLRSSARPGAQGSVLTLRVKKSDVDAFAEGRMKLETFQQRAVFNAYVGNGYGVLSVNSWAGSPKK